MMAKDREERYRDMIALDQDLYKVQIGETPDVEEPSSTQIATFSMSTTGARTPPAPPLGQAAPPLPPARSRSTTVHVDASPLGPRSSVAAATPAAPPTPAPTPATPATGTFLDEDLRFFETELAKRIGPLARVIVKKAAKKAPTIAALVVALAENIPDEAARTSFKAAVRLRGK
jgi:hypothetical protein